mmetsp:Transcript_20999/g.33890  ORF Transcript_20999/g.33890 Transcript_20999/m.33890 type:complete len:229 (-) Transcript_20999:275-961(-)
MDRLPSATLERSTDCLLHQHTSCNHCQSNSSLCHTQSKIAQTSNQHNCRVDLLDTRHHGCNRTQTRAHLAKTNSSLREVDTSACDDATMCQEEEMTVPSWRSNSPCCCRCCKPFSLGMPDMCHCFWLCTNPLGTRTLLRLWQLVHCCFLEELPRKTCMRLTRVVLSRFQVRKPYSPYRQDRSFQQDNLHMLLNHSRKIPFQVRNRCTCCDSVRNTCLPHMKCIPWHLW